MEEATFLTRFARSVTLVHRRDEFRASQDHAGPGPGQRQDQVPHQHAVVAVEGDTTVTGVRLRDTVTGEESTLPVTGVFVAIGHDPRSELVRGQVDLDADGYVLVESRTTSTRSTGVFAAGDLVDHTYRQAITAAGSGCVGGHRRRALAGRARDWPPQTTAEPTAPILIGAPQ